MFKILQNKSDYNEKRFQIGSICINLHYQGELDFLKFNKIPLSENEMGVLEKTIEVWYTERKVSDTKWFGECQKEAIRFIPQEISLFYQCLKASNIKCVLPEEHCNKYYKYGEWIMADFPYVSDDFFWIGNIQENLIYIFGKKECLIRIFGDLYSLMMGIFPIHGCAVADNCDALCFLGDSKCGKSLLTLYLLKLGMSYLTDDEVYICDNKIYSMHNFMQIRYEEDNMIRKVVTDITKIGYSSTNSAELAQIYVLRREGFPLYQQWIPCIAKQSFWWFIFVECETELYNIIINKLKRTNNIVREMIQKAKYVSIDVEAINKNTLYNKDEWNKILKEVY